MSWWPSNQLSHTYSYSVRPQFQHLHPDHVSDVLNFGDFVVNEKYFLDIHQGVQSFYLWYAVKWDIQLPVTKHTEEWWSYSQDYFNFSSLACIWSFFMRDLTSPFTVSKQDFVQFFFNLFHLRRKSDTTWGKSTPICSLLKLLPRSWTWTPCGHISERF